MIWASQLLCSEPFLCSHSVFFLLPILVASDTENYALSKEAFDSCLTSPDLHFFKNKFIHSFIHSFIFVFGCVGSPLLRAGFL